MTFSVSDILHPSPEVLEGVGGTGATNELLLKHIELQFSLHHAREAYVQLCLSRIIGAGTASGARPDETALRAVRRFAFGNSQELNLTCTREVGIILYIPSSHIYNLIASLTFPSCCITLNSWNAKLQRLCAQRRAC